jgi:hypothetical protein
MVGGSSMTEAEWLACTNPQPMLEFLRDKASDRKLRYFLVACARRVLPRSPDEDEFEALAVAERFADGMESRHRLARARSSLKTSYSARLSHLSPLYTGHIRSVPAWHATREQIVRAVREGSRCCAWSSTRRAFFGDYAAMTLPSEELAAQACLLRDLFGNPFRPVTLDPAVLTWHGGLLVSMARRMYDSRDFTDMPVLADGLEEAGCSDSDILGHCRSGGEHVRGCWVVDLLLGKS